jgi:diadenosine tetraphosphate (Ap4A) HIT family hydrolase
MNDTEAKPCVFCCMPQSSMIDQNKLAFAVWDKFPANDGHALIIPRRHIASFFEASSQELLAMQTLLHSAKALIEQTLRPDTYNIGINDGPLAGQTIPHLHLHLIPRYAGDVIDSRGGVRWVIPQRALY